MLWHIVWCVTGVCVHVSADRLARECGFSQASSVQDTANPASPDTEIVSESPLHQCDVAAQAYVSSLSLCTPVLFMLLLESTNTRSGVCAFLFLYVYLRGYVFFHSCVYYF